uniref:MYG1 protein n=1 Tax=Caenorhabditis japonica TaxID=281687 RepID=A0A8R1E1G8_CAEJA
MASLIGTHSGKFHCDEAFACFMLKQLPQFKDHSIVRTRDAAQLEKCDIVVDVGGVFDHSKQRYDHHQRGFTETMRTLEKLNFNTKLSSAGLVYAHYGKEVINQILGGSVESDKIDLFYHRLYEQFVEAIDAIDNGISQYDGVPRYHLPGNLSSRTGQFNAHWNEPENDVDERFQQAMQFIGGEFVRFLKYLANVWWPAREIIEQAVEKRFENDASGRIILIENGGCPWKEHFFDIEHEKNIGDDRITYILFQDTTNSSWRVQAIPVDKTFSFENRLPLPAAWRGLRDAELSKESGIDGGVFVHISGFIGGNLTREGALEMARKSLELDENPSKRAKLEQ